MSQNRSVWLRLPGALDRILLLPFVGLGVRRVFLFSRASNWDSTSEGRMKPLPGAGAATRTKSSRNGGN